MKKIVSFLLVLAMCASLAACGGGDDSEGPTDAQLKTLTEAYNQVATRYNDVAAMTQVNGWEADGETVAVLQVIGDTLDPIGKALTGDMSALEGADFDALPGALLEFLPVLQKLAETVSTPYAGGSGTGASADGGYYTDYPVLAQGVKVINAPSPAEELHSTGWEFVGGFVGGKEMSADEASKILEMYGGTLQIIFIDEKNAQMVQGGGTMAGTYCVLDDWITLNFAFEYQGTTYPYVAAFTEVKSDYAPGALDIVMLLVSPADSETVIYMRQMDER